MKQALKTLDPYKVGFKGQDIFLPRPTPRNLLVASSLRPLVMWDLDTLSPADGGMPDQWVLNFFETDKWHTHVAVSEDASFVAAQKAHAYGAAVHLSGIFGHEALSGFMPDARTQRLDTHGAAMLGRVLADIPSDHLQYVMVVSRREAFLSQAKAFGCQTVIMAGKGEAFTLSDADYQVADPKEVFTAVLGVKDPGHKRIWSRAEQANRTGLRGPL